MYTVKTYVTVVVQVNADGKKIPKEIFWKNGKCFTVSRVLGSKRAAAMMANSVGMRYEIEIGGRHAYIWDEGGRWFVEEHVS